VVEVGEAVVVETGEVRMTVMVLVLEVMQIQAQGYTRRCRRREEE